MNNVILDILFVMENHLDFILTIVFGLLAWFTYCHEVKAKRIKELARQVIAYYSEEQEVVKEIQNNTKESTKTIKMRLRNKASKNDNNLEGVYPSMTAKRARSYM